MDQILPPLSEWDEVKLCITFPLMTSILNSSNDVWNMLNDVTIEGLTSMVTYLAEFSISSDHETRSRSAAASSLFSILIHCKEDEGCNSIQALLENIVCSDLVDAASSLTQDLTAILTPRASCVPLESSARLPSFSRVEDTLNFVGLLVSWHMTRFLLLISSLHLSSHFTRMYTQHRARQQHAKVGLTPEQLMQLQLSWSKWHVMVTLKFHSLKQQYIWQLQLMMVKSNRYWIRHLMPTFYLQQHLAACSRFTTEVPFGDNE